MSFSKFCGQKVESKSNSQNDDFFSDGREAAMQDVNSLPENETTLRERDLEMKKFIEEFDQEYLSGKFVPEQILEPSGSCRNARIEDQTGQLEYLFQSTSEKGEKCVSNTSSISLDRKIPKRVPGDIVEVVLCKKDPIKLNDAQKKDLQLSFMIFMMLMSLCINGDEVQLYFLQITSGLIELGEWFLLVCYLKALPYVWDKLKKHGIFKEIEELINLHFKDKKDLVPKDDPQKKLSKKEKEEFLKNSEKNESQGKDFLFEFYYIFSLYKVEEIRNTVALALRIEKKFDLALNREIFISSGYLNELIINPKLQLETWERNEKLSSIQEKTEKLENSLNEFVQKCVQKNGMSSEPSYFDLATPKKMQSTVSTDLPSKSVSAETVFNQPCDELTMMGSPNKKTERKTSDQEKEQYNIQLAPLLLIETLNTHILSKLWNSIRSFSAKLNLKACSGLSDLLKDIQRTHRIGLFDGFHSYLSEGYNDESDCLRVGFSLPDLASFKLKVESELTDPKFKQSSPSSKLQKDTRDLTRKFKTCIQKSFQDQLKDDSLGKRTPSSILVGLKVPTDEEWTSLMSSLFTTFLDEALETAEDVRTK